MSKSSWVAVMGVATALVALPAVAQGLNGFYAGATVGKSKARDWCTGADGFVVSCDDRKNAWKLFGGYQITRNFAVEAGYANLGKFSADFGGGETALGAGVGQKSNVDVLGISALWRF